MANGQIQMNFAFGSEVCDVPMFILKVTHAKLRGVLIYIITQSELNNVAAMVRK